MRRRILVIALLCCSHEIAAQEILEAQGASFGHALALDGNVLAVGAPAYQKGHGGLWIYARSNLAWQLVYEEKGADGDSLGFSLALDGNWLLAGAPGARSVRWYELTGGQWQRAHRVEDDKPGFGRAVALAGIFTAVGSPEFERARGAVDLFVLSGQSAWSHRTVLYGTSHTAFGASLAMNTETLFIGAPLSDEPRGRDAGLVHVYDRTGGSDWVLQADLTANNAGSDREFGRALALDDNGEYSYAVIGAPRNQMSYLFVRSDSLWLQTDVFRPVPLMPEQESGISVDLSLNTAIIGSPSSAPGQPGTVQLLDIDEFHNWYPSHTLTGGSRFGRSVQFDSSYIVIGAPGSAIYGYRETTLSSQEPTTPLANLSAFPNPFTDELTIELGLAAESVWIWDITGQLITTLYTGGQSRIRWRPQGLAAGIYVARAKGASTRIVYVPE